MDEKDFPKAYEAAEHEDRIYKQEMDSGFFNPDKLPGERKEPFTIMLPPPNVTGTLHMGHAVMLAVEDVLTRTARMQGKKTLWLPGTDHAAIATQSKVEGILMEEGKSRHDLGREAFLDRVRTFASDSHDTIVNQMKKMGASVDWSREAYTLDNARNRAVNEAFKRMYEDGLIYRGKRIVNWDPVLQTTVSDDEVDYREERAPFYYFQYGPFVIATSRPETKFGDKHVVMHPNDERYAQYKDGQQIDLEWINGPITATVIKDEAIDMAFGSGVMTITPSHDATDFEIAKRHGLAIEPVIDMEGKLLPIAGGFAGLPIKEARKKIVKKLEEKGLLVKVDEKYIHRVAVNSRGEGIIEPQIKEQWFIDVNKPFKMRQSKLDGIQAGDQVTLKQLMQTVVKNGQIKILPERFEKTYFHWINNLRDWNISRQIWFGHRVPVWYCKGGGGRGEGGGQEIQVGIAPSGDGWEQDSDTLDTWFSSGLWTFSSLGWPDETSDLKTFHPTTVLETGYDILFFWVARMILMTTYLLGDIPFKDAYLHGLVRDEKGRKMSKSLGNIIDPLEMINKYGADATRLSLLIGSTPGNDSKLNEEKIAGYKHFTNKLWNISRFVLTKVEQTMVPEQVEPATRADAWIIARLANTHYLVTRHLAAYELSAAGETLREFTWSEFADWYLEIAKTQSSANTEKILLYVLDKLIRLWHPFMPFVTEVIWEKMGNKDLLLAAAWPKEMVAPAVMEFDQVMSVVSSIRTLRSLYRLPPGQRVRVSVFAKDATILKEESAVIETMGKTESLTFLETPLHQKGLACAMAGTVSVYVDLAGLIDPAAELARLSKELEQTQKYITSTSARLANKDFAANAPVEIIEQTKKLIAEAQEKVALLAGQLQSL
ncbi:valine--tRNA ligase [Candidatus Uhrbacteria bacterium]|nr:valine--tRNA ligase [Candidatus Uhrbacteria bacterium]